jgi:hypothetical protein
MTLYWLEVIRLQVGQPIGLLEHLEPLVALESC